MKCDLQERENESGDTASMNSCSAVIRTGSMHVNEVSGVFEESRCPSSSPC